MPDLKDLAQLTLFPGKFSAEQACHLFPTSDQRKQSPLRAEADSRIRAETVESALHQLLSERGPAAIAQHEHGYWELEKHFKAELAAKYPCSLHTRCRFVESCLIRIHAHNDKQGQVENVKEFLSWLVKGYLPVEVVRNSPWGIDLCAAFDRMFPFLKYSHEAVAAFRLLLQHPHDPRCPFCVFHMYPVLHSLAMFKEMEDVLQVVRDRGYNSENMMYGKYNVYLDYLTCLSYNRANQMQFDLAEHNARDALKLCMDPSQKLNNVNNLAFALRKLGKLKEAESVVREYMELYLDSVDVRIAAEAHLTLGNTLRALGQLEQACECHEKALHLAADIDHIKDVDDLVLLIQYHAAKTFMQMPDCSRIAQAVVLMSEAKQIQESRFAGHPIVDKMRAYLYEGVMLLYAFNSRCKQNQSCQLGPCHTCSSH